MSDNKDRDSFMGVVYIPGYNKDTVEDALKMYEQMLLIKKANKEMEKIIGSVGRPLDTVRGIKSLKEALIAAKRFSLTYIAVDFSNEIHGYTEQPYLEHYCWDGGGKVKFLGIYGGNKPWETTLRRLPFDTGDDDE